MAYFGQYPEGHICTAARAFFAGAPDAYASKLNLYSDIFRPDDWRRFLDFHRNEAFHVVRRSAGRLDPEVLEQGLRLVRLQVVVCRRIQPSDDIGRRNKRCHQRVPYVGLESRKPRLGCGHDISQLGPTLRTGDRERLDLPALNGRDIGRDRVHRDVVILADQVGDNGWTSLVLQIIEFDARLRSADGCR